MLRSRHSAEYRATDRFAFVRDGFHFWAALLGPLWLAWHRLWLALIGWIVVMAAIDVGMVDARRRQRDAIFLVECLARAADGI